MNRIGFIIGVVIASAITFPLAMILAHRMECRLLHPPYLLGECHEQ